jgi:long-chain acyl-CoA synthetase
MEVAQFFERMGVTVLQGYGLTETSPVVAVNTPEHNRLGSVGRPLPGTHLRINREGEIVVRGPAVMRGYYKRADLTREVMDDDGWFHTGDLGAIDDDGFVYVTGRIKNIIVLGSGKKVSPEEVEAVLAESPGFREVCVIGGISRDRLSEGSEIVCAVIVPSDALAADCGGDMEALQERVRLEVLRLSERLAPYKRPARIILRSDEFPKTSTRKIRRALVQDWLRQLEQPNTVLQAEAFAGGAA